MAPCRLRGVAPPGQDQQTHVAEGAIGHQTADIGLGDGVEGAVHGGGGSGDGDQHDQWAQESGRNPTPKRSSP